VLFDGDTATARSYMHVLSMPMGGVYETEVVRTADGWRIRLMVLDERRFEEIEARLQTHMAAVDDTAWRPDARAVTPRPRRRCRHSRQPMRSRHRPVCPTRRVHG
jgi:hypothetical protein